MTSIGGFLLRFYFPLALSVAMFAAVWLVHFVKPGNEADPDRSGGTPRTKVAEGKLPAEGQPRSKQDSTLRNRKVGKAIGPLTGVERGTTQISVQVGFVSFPLPVERLWVVRASLICGGLFCLAAGLGTDFSRFFPSRLRMNVYFDEPGIESTLADFTDRERADAGISGTWKTYGTQYYAEVKIHLAKLWSGIGSNYARDTAYITAETVSASGETTFIVERVGILAYRITESSGHLEHTIESPNIETKTFLTFFELMNTEYNHLRPSLGRLLTDPTYVIRPEFKQILSLDPRRGRTAPFDHVLIGMTKIRLLPFPQFGNTVYLWKLPNVGAVPIGYAVYY